MHVRPVSVRVLRASARWKSCRSWRLGAIAALLATVAGLEYSVAQQADGQAPIESKPPMPSASLAAMRLLDGFQVECVAAEPEVQDPISIRFDELGRMWVVEMPDYPMPVDPQAPPQGRIRRLEDRDGDGRFETSVEFAKGLNFATGLQPWKDGWLVTVAGRLIHLRDTDDDGQADCEETWIEGFAQDNTQLRANHPTLSIDGRIYIANGLRGGEVREAGTEGTNPISLQGNDLQLDPHTRWIGAVTGVGQFGMTFDDVGRRFICSNRNPGMHVVLEPQDILLGSRAQVSRLVQDVAAAGEASRIFPISRFWTTSNLHAGQFTAACGVLRFRGLGLGKAGENWLLTCDPTGNLVHAETLEPWGPTFRGKSVAEGREFLASGDAWFRPVDLQIGPDGALYVVDMCRAVIEHPDFMPAELKSRADLRWGTGAGRIWRVSTVGYPRRRAEPFTDPVADLGSSNPWRRDTAFRLLLQQGAALEAQTKAALQRLLDDESAMSAARVAALTLLTEFPKGRILEGEEQPESEEFSLEQWTRVMHSADPVVRAAVIRRARHLGTRRLIGLSELFGSDHQAFSNEPDPVVRFELALALQYSDDKDLLANIAISAQDPWTLEAVKISADDQAHEVLNALPEELTLTDSGMQFAADLAALAVDFDRVIAGDDEPRVAAVLQWLRSRAWSWKEQRAGWLILMAAAESGGWTERLQQRVAPPGWSADDLAWFEERLAELHDAVQQGVADESLRAVAIRSLALWGANVESLVERVLQSEEPLASRLAAVEGCRRVDDVESWQRWWELAGAEGPAVRGALIKSALETAAGRKTLVEAIQAGRVRSTELDGASRSRLERAEPEIAAAFQAWLTQEQAARASFDAAPYLTALGGPSDPRRGRTLFGMHCANCHRIGDLGTDVAPDISDSRDKDPRQILRDLLDPNAAIDANFVAHQVETQDGGNFAGILVADTGESFTLKQSGGKLVTVRRSEMVAMESTGKSLMPEGLSGTLAPQDAADIVAFIKGWRYLDGAIPLQPGNESR